VDYAPYIPKSVLSLQFAGYSTETKRKPRSDTYVHSNKIDQGQFNRFVDLFHLQTDTREDADRESTFPLAQMRHLVVNLSHKKYGQVVVDQKSLQVSRQYLRFGRHSLTYTLHGAGGERPQFNFEV
jgi:hypothetical protein